jgi:hypothetical protein
VLHGENPGMGTIHDRLVELGANEREMLQAADLLTRVVPLGRPVVLTDEIIAAARAGDQFLVTCLLAEEAEPDLEDREAIARAEQENDGSSVDLEDFRRTLLGDA